MPITPEPIARDEEAELVEALVAVRRAACEAIPSCVLGHGWGSGLLTGLMSTFEDRATEVPGIFLRQPSGPLKAARATGSRYGDASPPEQRLDRSVLYIEEGEAHFALVNQQAPALDNAAISDCPDMDAAPELVEAEGEEIKEEGREDRWLDREAGRLSLSKFELMLRHGEHPIFNHRLHPAYVLNDPAQTAE